MRKTAGPQDHGESGTQADLGFIGGSRTASDFIRAQRHSRMVGLLKFGLPAVATVAVVAVLLAFFISSSRIPSVGFGRTKIEDGKLVMDSPNINGFDANQRPYSLTARKAVQDSDRPTHIRLEEIEAHLPVNGGIAVVKAGNGTYDADGKTLQLGGSVSVDTQDGMSVRLKDAEIDITTGVLKTNNPVIVDTGRAVVSSDALSVDDKGKHVVFENRVRMTIRADDDAPAGTVPADLGKMQLQPVRVLPATDNKEAPRQ